MMLDAELIEPLRLTGRLRDAERLARALLDGGPEPTVAVLVHTGLAGVLSTAARYPEAIDHLEQAAVAAPEPEREFLAATGAVLMVLAGQVERARVAGAASGRRRGASGQRQGSVPGTAGLGDGGAR